MKKISAKVLVADDDSEFREVLIELLESEGYEVFGAGSGLEAVQLVARHKIDLVMTDVRMPDGNGIELLKTIRGELPVRPLMIVVTAYSDMEEDDVIKVGAQVLFRKPFNIKELLLMVGHLLDQRKSKSHEIS